MRDDLSVPVAAFDAFLAGERSLAMTVVQGEASYTGTARRLLRVAPVLARVAGDRR